MKALLVICMVLVFSQSLFSQQTEIETKLKGIQAKSIQGEKLVDYDLINHVKNKVVILEFWETWCGPCIEGMHHLKDLKNKFPNDLQIICVSSDDFKKAVNFIKENKYPFDYVFDAKKQLSFLFPHTGIPHTVVIGKKGKIKTETLPVYLTEDIIRNLISIDSIDVPFKNNFDPTKLGNNKTEPSLLLFDLKNTELGDRNYTSYSTSVNKKRIVTGYTANAFKDTVETIQHSKFAGKNILELYCYAYKKLSEFRFLFPKDLNYINSYSPNNSYKLNYSVSNLFGDYHSVMIRQLNAAFGLETEKVQLDTTVLVLKKIEPNGRSITIENNPSRDSGTGESDMSFQHFKAKVTLYSLQDIAHLIETKTYLPVESHETDTNKYNLDILIISKGKTLEEWLPLFEKEGIFLVKEKKKAEFIRIKKARDDY